MVYLDTLKVFSKSVRESEIRAELAWIAANREHAKRIFEECNP